MLCQESSRPRSSNDLVYSQAWRATFTFCPDNCINCISQGFQ